MFDVVIKNSDFILGSALGTLVKRGTFYRVIIHYFLIYVNSFCEKLYFGHIIFLAQKALRTKPLCVFENTSQTSRNSAAARRSPDRERLTFAERKQKRFQLGIQNIVIIDQRMAKILKRFV